MVEDRQTVDQVSKQIPDCPTDLSYMETTYGVKFKWKGKQDKDFPVTGYVIGCGIVAEGGTYLYNVGPEDEEYEFSDLFSNTNYILTIQAFNIHGYSETAGIKVKTGEHVLQDDNDSDSDGDELFCGLCEYVCNKIDKFQKHKKECRKIFAGTKKSYLPSYRVGAFVIKTDDIITADQVNNINQDKANISADGIDLCLAETGSLIVWTVISNELFQSKTLFKEKLKLFLENLLENCYLDMETTSRIEVEVMLNIKEDIKIGKDRLQCGRCKTVFTDLDEFRNHKIEADERRHTPRGNLLVERYNFVH
ncbi:uncharacterized protein LOC143078639 [Mytilus galloprovincialis]|uniref:uncharacterized protein LOC143078639 n=1 Tax=Mytilus galloprovincialis TaxID=29158 RepID=UPI003F7B5BBC